MGGPLLIAWLLFGRRQVPSALGLDHNPLPGLGFALAATAPMLVYFALSTPLAPPERPFVALLQSSLLPGLGEELFFRAFLFGFLYRYAGWGFLPAALLVAVTFGAGHLYQGNLRQRGGPHGLQRDPSRGHPSVYRRHDRDREESRTQPAGSRTRVAPLDSVSVSTRWGMAYTPAGWVERKRRSMRREIRHPSPETIRSRRWRGCASRSRKVKRPKSLTLRPKRRVRTEWCYGASARDTEARPWFALKGFEAAMIGSRASKVRLGPARAGTAMTWSSKATRPNASERSSRETVFRSSSGADHSRLFCRAGLTHVPRTDICPNTRDHPRWQPSEHRQPRCGPCCQSGFGFGCARNRTTCRSPSRLREPESGFAWPRRGTDRSPPPRDVATRRDGCRRDSSLPPALRAVRREWRNRIRHG